MGFGLLIAGFILLANPVIHVVDLFPDAIGFLLIYAGLTKLSFFIGEIEQARRQYFKLAVLEVAKFFSIAFIPYTSNSALVLMAFVYGVLELLLFIPALNHTFEGLSFSGLRYNGRAIYDKVTLRCWATERYEKKGMEKQRLTYKKRPVERQTLVKNTILAFYIFRVIATLAPELTELQLYDNLGSVHQLQYSYAHYKPYLYVIFSVAVLIWGLVMILRSASFFGKIRRDEKYISTLKEKYETDILPKTNLFTALRVKRALIVFIISVLASFILPADGVNLLIGLIPSVLLMIAALILKRNDKRMLTLVPVCILRSVLSIVNLLCQIRFFYVNEYTIEAVALVEKANAQYGNITLWATVEYLVALLSVLIFLVLLASIVKQNLSDFGIRHESAQYSKLQHDGEVFAQIKNKLLWCAVLAAAHYIGTVAYHYFLPTVNVISAISPFITLVYAAYVIHTVRFAFDEIYTKEIEYS